jgi:predicted SprT family Zn-dependent metalloprotease
LAELIPHEVTHAVMHRLGGVHCTDDESLATAVGVLSARIARKIEQGVIYE